MSENELELKIREMVKNWPKEIKRKDIEKLRKAFGINNISSNDFVLLFQRATGYVDYGLKFRRELDYRDPTLREIAFEMLEKKRIKRHNNKWTVRFAGKDFEEFAGDIRYYLGYYLIFSMISKVPSLVNRMYSKEDILTWTRRIVKAIPEALRWKMLPNDFESVYNEFDKLNTSEEVNYETLNFVEKVISINLIIYKMRFTRKNVVDNVFSKFLQDLGMKGIEKYFQFMNFFGRIPYNVLENDLWYAFDRDLKSIEKELGVNKNAFTLGVSELKKIILGELHRCFVPLFFEMGKAAMDLALKKRGVVVSPKDGFIFDRRFLVANQIGSVCYSLPKCMERIIDDSYKGRAFQYLLYEILKGEWIISYDTKIFNVILRKPDVSRQDIPAVRDMNDTKYFYLDPEHTKGLEVEIDIGGKKREEDLILVHKRTPKHILVAQCKFTKRYDEKMYREGRDHVKETCRILKNKSVRSTLGIPNYPLVPVLFTSLSGKIYKEDDEILKATLPLIVSGKFKEWLQEYFKSQKRFNTH
ncbi:MAG: hypothetical protein ACTSUQ_05075 [Candidatus Freyarchaeota archaeon]